MAKTLSLTLNDVYEYKWINVQGVQCIVCLFQARLPWKRQQWWNRGNLLKDKVGKVHFFAKLDVLTALYGRVQCWLYSRCKCMGNIPHQFGKEKFPFCQKECVTISDWAVVRLCCIYLSQWSPSSNFLAGSSSLHCKCPWIYGINWG